MEKKRKKVVKYRKKVKKKLVKSKKKTEDDWHFCPDCGMILRFRSADHNRLEAYCLVCGFIGTVKLRKVTLKEEARPKKAPPPLPTAKELNAATGADKFIHDYQIERLKEHELRKEW